MSGDRPWRCRFGFHRMSAWESFEMVGLRFRRRGCLDCGYMDIRSKAVS